MPLDPPSSAPGDVPVVAQTETPPSPVEDAPLTGLQALALYQDAPVAAEATKEPVPVPAAAAEATSPAAESAVEAPTPEPKPDQRMASAFRKLAEEKAALRQQTLQHEARLKRADEVEGFLAGLRDNPLAILEVAGSDFVERLALAQAGVSKPVTEADRIAALEARIAKADEAAKERRDAAKVEQEKAVIANGQRTVESWLTEANKDGRFETTIALGKHVEVFDAVSIYCAKHQVPPTVELVHAIGDEVEKQLVDEYGAVAEKVSKIRSRFVPAPAAAQAVPPKAQPPAREAVTAPATITSRHAADAPPPVRNGRKSLAELDDEIADRYWGRQ